MIAAGIRANEVSALRTISAIHSAQAQYQSRTNRFAVTLPEFTNSCREPTKATFVSDHSLSVQEGAGKEVEN